MTTKSGLSRVKEALSLPSPAAARGDTLPSLLLGRDDDPAVLALADAVSTHVLMLSQLEMYDAPFIWRHRIERNRLAVVAGSVGHAAGQAAQLILAAEPVILSVH